MSVLSEPKRINKDWGYEIWMANNEEENYCGKILYIKAGHSTSMHFHAKKHETFYILEGVLELELICTASTKKYKKVLNKGEVFILERLLPHRLIAKDGDVKFVEISTHHDDSDSYRVYREAPEQLSIT